MEHRERESDGEEREQDKSRDLARATRQRCHVSDASTVRDASSRFRGDATCPFTTTIPPPPLLTPALPFPILPRSRPPPAYHRPSCSPPCRGICSLPRSRQLGRPACDVAGLTRHACPSHGASYTPNAFPALTQPLGSLAGRPSHSDASATPLYTTGEFELTPIRF